MPRRLDDYSFDASGFGNLVRGRDSEVTTPMGVVRYRKGLFDKNPYDKEGNLLPDTKAGRQIKGDLKLKELGLASSEGSINRLADEAHRRAMTAELSRITGLSDARARELVSQTASNVTINDNQAKNAKDIDNNTQKNFLETPAQKKATAEFEAALNSGVFQSKAIADKDNAEANSRQSRTATTARLNRIADIGIGQSDANRRLTESQTDANRYIPIGQGGNIRIGPGGIPLATTSPFWQNVETTPATYDAKGNLVSGAAQKTRAQQPITNRSMYDEFGPSGSVIPPTTTPTPTTTPAPTPIPVSQPLGAINPISQDIRNTMGIPIKQEVPSAFSQAQALGHPGNSTADMILKSFGINGLPRNPLSGLMPSPEQFDSMRSSPEAALLRKFGINIAPTNLFPSSATPSTMPMSRPFKF